ncbi:hypothetical protein [Luteimicrobium subarcticum]|uniref:hypothetical protein n=1 Tax=Luteimicrobium subarcticum TaxID=620910 RepID=UPI000C24DC63|nr:hypothetical protein [Luteimicrobium subarcticum]
MLHRILGALLVVGGLVAVTLGVASATVWRTSPTVTATTSTVAADSSESSATLLTTAPGVLDLVDDTVALTATSPNGGDVVVAVGRTADVAGWVGSDPLVTVDGLTTWDRLSTSASTGAPARASSAAAPDPRGSDMWLQEVEGTGSASLRMSDVPAGTTVLVAGVGDDAELPTLALTWDRTVTTPYLWPLVLVGLVLVVAGAVVLAVGRARVRSRRARAAVRRPSDAPQGATATMTRRELREHADRIQREGGKGKGRRPDPAPERAPVAEAPAETVAIQVPEETRGAADAWRRRWNVPARIPPTGTEDLPDVAPQPVAAPVRTTVPQPPARTRASVRAAQTTAQTPAPQQPTRGAGHAPAPTVVWSPLRPDPQSTPNDTQDGGRA